MGDTEGREPVKSVRYFECEFRFVKLRSKIAATPEPRDFRVKITQTGEDDDGPAKAENDAENGSRRGKRVECD